MKVNEMTNLWCVENTEEDFKILVVALDAEEAMEISREYFCDSSMEDDPDVIEITPFNDIKTKFDCDYVIG